MKRIWQTAINGDLILYLDPFHARVKSESPSGKYRAEFMWLESAHLFENVEDAKRIALKLARKTLEDALRELDEMENE